MDFHYDSSFFCSSKHFSLRQSQLCTISRERPCARKFDIVVHYDVKLCCVLKLQ